MKTFELVTQKKCQLNEFIRQSLPPLLNKEVSNSKIRRLIVAGSVFVDGRQIRVPSYAVFEGKKVVVEVDEEKLFYEKDNGDIHFELTSADVLFEDESIIVVNKPAHFPTEGTMQADRDNLHAAVVRYLFEKQKTEHPNAKNPPYAGIMHRLDRDTSGVILFSKSRAVNAPLHRMFEEHTAQKTYFALCQLQKGVSVKEGERFTVDFYMDRISPKSAAAKWGRVSEGKGQKSRTDFCVKKVSGSRALIECRPLTGRTHQIRVHLASAKMPIVGDTLYGGPSAERICLHAYMLEFTHPVTGEKMCIKADNIGF
ncbi:MAG: RluA family pseudouridine synthase [Treponema sp.]|nr:RluA family pseudouridine synthase [Treponema sp.]